MRKSPGIGQATSEMRRAPFKGIQVNRLFYTCAGTDLAQPIRFVRDSYVMG